MQGQTDWPLLAHIIVVLASSVALVATLLWAWLAVDVVKREFPTPRTRIVWLLVVLLGGWVGAWIYYIVGMEQGTWPSPHRKPPDPPERDPELEAELELDPKSM